MCFKKVRITEQQKVSCTYGAVFFIINKKNTTLIKWSPNVPHRYPYPEVKMVPYLFSWAQAWLSLCSQRSFASNVEVPARCPSISGGSLLLTTEGVGREDAYVWIGSAGTVTQRVGPVTWNSWSFLGTLDWWRQANTQYIPSMHAHLHTHGLSMCTQQIIQHIHLQWHVMINTGKKK